MKQLVEPNKFALFPGAGRARANSEIMDIIDDFAGQLAGVTHAWRHLGARDTAAREAIFEYIEEALNRERLGE